MTSTPETLDELHQILSDGSEGSEGGPACMVSLVQIWLTSCNHLLISHFFSKADGDTLMGSEASRINCRLRVSIQIELDFILTVLSKTEGHDAYSVNTPTKD